VINTPSRAGSIALLPGETLLSGGSKTIHVWDLESGKEARTFKTELETFSSVCASADGKQAASCDGQGRITLWDVEKGETLRAFATTAAFPAPCAVALSADGKLIAAAQERSVLVWNAATGDLLQRLPEQANEVKTLVFAPDGGSLLTAAGKSLQQWNVATGKSIRAWDTHAKDAICVAFSPDGTKAASGSSDGTVVVWNAATGASLGVLTGHKTEVQAVVFTLDGRLASGSGGIDPATVQGGSGFHFGANHDCCVRLWNLKEFEEICCFEGHKSPIAALAVSKDGRRLISSADDIRIWPLPGH